MRLPPILFVRHGETDWNREGRLQGGRDIPLNDKGRRQAVEAGRRLVPLMAALGGPEAARFVVSPLGRTRETAELARTAAGLPASGYGLDERLREFSFGDWEGLTWPEAKTRHPALVKARRTDKWRFTPPGGESYAALAERVRGFLATLDGPAVLVSHGGVARTLMVTLGGLSILAAPNTEVEQGRVLRFAEGRFAWA